MSGLILTEDFIAAFRAESHRPELAHNTHGTEFRLAQMLPEKKNGARGRFFITPHAVQRYIERYRPWISRERALEELILITSAARYVEPARSCGGGELWKGPRIGRKARQDIRSRLRFIVRDGANEGDLPQVVTVLSCPWVRTKAARLVETTQ